MASTQEQVASSATTVQVGFGTGTIAMMIRASQNNAASGNVEYVPDENGDDSIAVVSNKGVRLTAEGALITGQTAPVKGDVVTIGTTKYLVEEASTAHTATVTRLSLTLYANSGNVWASS